MCTGEIEVVRWARGRGDGELFERQSDKVASPPKAVGHENASGRVIGSSLRSGAMAGADRRVDLILGRGAYADRPDPVEEGHGRVKASGRRSVFLR